MKLKHRKKIMLVTLSLLILFTVSCSNAEKQPAEGDQTSFQILFTSDLHGAFLNYNYATDSETIGGFSKVASVIKEEKANFDGPTIILDNGDTIQGNGTGVFLNNEDFTPFPLVEALNLAEYDAIGLGNHEFNFGIETMYKAYDGFQGEKLNGNVIDSNGNYLEGFKPYTIKTLSGGLRVAIISMTTPNIDMWDTANITGAGYTALNPSEQTRKIIDELKSENLADVYIAMQHMGDIGEYGRDGSGAIEVIAENPELAVFLGAHYHTIVGTKDKQVVINDTVKFVENKQGGGSVGKIMITATYENGKWVVKNQTGTYEESDVKTDVIEIKEDTPIDMNIVNAMSEADAFVKQYINGTIIGKLEGGALVPEPEIKGTYEGILQDTALIDLVNNTMLYYTNADVSGTAPLEMGANCQPGEISIGNVVQIYKYDNNTLYTLKMTGAQLKQWMEWSYSYFGSSIDAVVDHTKPAVNIDTDLTIPYGTMQVYNQDQFAGIRYEVDLTKGVGDRINILSMADGSPFSLEKDYTAAVNNYRSTTQLLATSPTGVFKPGEKTAELIASDIQGPDGSTSMMDLIAGYIAIQPEQTIYNTKDDNWKFVGLDWDEDYREAAVYAINNDLIITDFKVPVTKADIDALVEEGKITIPIS